MKGSVETLVRRVDRVVFISTMKREKDKPRTTLQELLEGMTRRIIPIEFGF